MEKQKVELIEERQFNEAAYAEDVLKLCQMQLEKIKLGMIIAGIATVSSIIMVLTSKIEIISNACFIISVIGAIVAYIIGGGFGSAVKFAVKLAKWGWFICPVFPIDILVFIVVLILAIIAFFFLPVIFVFLHYRQVKADKDAAETYLSYCEPVEKNDC